MKTSRISALSLLVGLALNSAACVDIDTSDDGENSFESRSQAITVVPQFHITGADEGPDSLFLTRLGLVVSEIRLVPVSAENGLAYSSAEPIALNFDLAEGEFDKTSAPMILPTAGRYVVSIRLEPVAVLDGELSPSSFSMDGFVAEVPEIGNPAKVSDGTPLPLPFEKRPDVEDANGVKVWTPFAYNSTQTIFFTFTDVELAQGEQLLNFNFDVTKWSVDAVEPISKAIRNSATSDEVDVTRQVESTGRGVAALIRSGDVETDAVR